MFIEITFTFSNCFHIYNVILSPQQVSEGTRAGIICVLPSVVPGPTEAERLAYSYRVPLVVLCLSPTLDLLSPNIKPWLPKNIIDGCKLDSHKSCCRNYSYSISKAPYTMSPQLNNHNINIMLVGHYPLCQTCYNNYFI